MVTKKTFLLEIEVDEENIKNKYPNFGSNYEDGTDFIDTITNDMVTSIDGVNLSRDGIKTWGYSVKITDLPNDAEAKYSTRISNEEKLLDKNAKADFEAQDFDTFGEDKI